MAIRFLIENGRIIFEGHSDLVEDCRTVTALCDALNASEDFRTVKYESGYAEFEQVSGGESMMFMIKSCTCDPSKYASKDEFDKFLRELWHVEAVISENLPQTACVKGIWVFNNNVSFPTLVLSQNINFTAYASSEDAEPTSYSNIQTLPNSSSITISYSGTTAYYESSSGGTGWNSETFKTIDFGDEPQACSQDFYKWLKANATGEDIEQDAGGVVSKYKLPFTASELVEKLNQI